eukprot:TRINITY_DN50103_c0_g1_i1.p1 TRINITY_DN50103_c0_g1~~TRINITY_DN50103_c0_g1_i1.p1  ORF type:complete len:352 (-),score=1.89 TRINITY_DN50103_c0_g1_i1:110-1165(-)
MTSFHRRRSEMIDALLSGDVSPWSWLVSSLYCRSMHGVLPTTAFLRFWRSSLSCFRDNSDRSQSSDCRASSFLSHAASVGAPDAHTLPCSRSDLYPCPLIHEPKLSPPKSGRRRTRWFRLRRLHRSANVIITFSNWEVLGRPRDCIDMTWIRRSHSRLQYALIDRLLVACKGLDRRRPSGWRGGRSSMRDRILDLRSGLYVGGSTGAPGWLTASNASLPRIAGVASLSSEMNHPILAEVCSTPHIFDKDPSAFPMSVPRSCSRVAPKDWPALAAAAYSVGLLRLIHVHSVPLCRGIPAVSELFGVVKKLTQALRVIVDRRIRNCMEKSLLEVLRDMSSWTSRPRSRRSRRP